MYEEGLSKRAIAKALKMSRNTVRKVLEQEQFKKYERKGKEDHMIAPYEKQIIDFLEQDLIGTRIYKELQKLGYTGSLTTVYRYINKVKESVPAKTTVRFETPPGKQAQFDWSTYTVDMNGKQVTVYCFLLILGYSRKKYMTFSFNQTTESVMEALEEGLHQFGGVPKEILIDNAKQMIIEHTKEDTVRYHPHFLQFAGTYRFKPSACKVKWPRTKGKVERPFYYIEQHFIKGNRFENLDDLISKGHVFIEEWEQEPNKTTLVAPVERFKEEKELLSALPHVQYTNSIREPRKVSWDCLISYRGVRYSVPHKFAGKQLWIRSSHGEKLEVYSPEGELITEHTICDEKGKIISLSEHYEGLLSSTPKSLPKAREIFAKVFPSGKEFHEQLLQKTSYNNLYHLQKILDLRNYYSDETIEIGLKQALIHRRYDFHFIQNILKDYPKKEQSKIIQRKIPEIQTATRALSYYSQLLH